ncbi:MAG: CoA transferase, partial [Pseudomonadota bacterium]
MALYRRTETGKGDYIDLAMYDAAIAWTPNVLGPTFGEDRHPEPKQMRSFGGSALTHLYETSDGEFLVFSGPELKFATNLLTALGRPDLIEIAKRPPGPEQSPLRAYFADTFKTRTLADWQTFLAPIDCAWSWVRSLKDAFDDPFTKEREMVFTDADGHRHVGPPIKFRNEPPQPDPAVPAFGEHSEAIAAEAGLDAASISALKSKGTI